MLKKNNYIDQLQVGDRLDDLFLVKSARLSETKAGKPYLILVVVDKTGEISGPVWDQAERAHAICAVGAFIRVRGQVQSYRDALQLKVDHIEAVNREEVDVADFVIAYAGDHKQVADDIQKLVRSVTNPFIKKLLGRLFKKEEIWTSYQESPAAKGIHHAYLGGLMEHALSLARVADFLSSHYPGVDRSLVIAGALLHDIGKIHELKSELGLVEYTLQGRLKGHLVIGSEMVGEAAARIKDFPEELLVQLQHLILSHHGRLEFGSPTVPQTVEAVLLSFVDDLDSKMNLIEGLRRKQKEPGYQWSDYQRSMERYLYLQPLGVHEDHEQAREDEKEAAKPLSKQQSLF